jgi:signal transduction histidine kinase
MQDEAAVSSGSCAVYFYDKTNWKPLDSGISSIGLYHSPSRGTYRIIAFDAKTQQPIINSSVWNEMKYQVVSEMFHQFADVRNAYGLNFASSAEASAFSAAVLAAIKEVGGTTSGASEAQRKQEEERKRKEELEKKKQEEERRRKEELEKKQQEEEKKKKGA